jgi:protein-S-isoprenylcysteine O-methyltransferase Ste14
VAFSWSKFRVRSVWLIAVPFFWFAEPTPVLLGVGLALALVGLWIRGWAAGTIHKNEVLTTTGPYARTRNPLYLGSFLIGGGVTLAGGHWIWPLVFSVFFLVVYRTTIAKETRYLSERFPEAYARYAAEVPVFVPRLSAYGDAASAGGGQVRFGWPLYRHNREWEAALGVGAVFALLAAKALL